MIDIQLINRVLQNDDKTVNDEELESLKAFFEKVQEFKHAKQKLGFTKYSKEEQNEFDNKQIDIYKIIKYNDPSYKYGK